MFNIQRLKAALRYLLRANPVYKWRVGSFVCPNCGKTMFLSLRPDSFMTRCLTCFANGTNLSLIPVIQRHQKTNSISCAYELSTFGATLGWLRENVNRVTTSEYFPSESFGTYINGTLNEDVQKLTFADSSFDLITSNQVFEHVPNDILGYSECFRTLRAGGALIFTVPLCDIPKTEMLAEVVAGQLIYYREPEYHDSRFGGAKSAFTFWHHSKNDICQRVSSVGFHVELVDVNIFRNQIAPTQVVYAMKP